MAPLSPSSTVSLALYWALVGRQVCGGASGITSALLKACSTAGVTIKTTTPVTGILMEQNRAVGVKTLNGEHRADSILSTIGVATTGLSLLPTGTLPASVEQRLTHIRSRGNLAKIHFAVKGDCPWAQDETENTQYQIGAHPLTLEKAFDDAKAGKLPSAPALDIRVLRDGLAPAGHHVLSVLVYAVPTADDSFWDGENSTAELISCVKSAITSVWPEFEAQCQQVQALSPRDLAHNYGLPGGHLFHSEWALDQLWSFRPTGALAQNRTLVDGLILAGSGTHGGGALRGTAGFLATK